MKGDRAPPPHRSGSAHDRAGRRAGRREPGERSGFARRERSERRECRMRQIATKAEMHATVMNQKYCTVHPLFHKPVILSTVKIMYERIFKIVLV